MSLFQCAKCGCKENTALTMGYRGGIFEPREGFDPQSHYCSACWEGEWHGEFPRVFYPLGTMRTDRDGSSARHGAARRGE